ncbi:patatin-like phospholipase family protein [Candidatus Omnitrophota bacterium]
MQLVDKETILKEIPLFADLSAEEFRIVKERAHFREYKKGQVIYAEGDAPDAFYCVILGRAAVFTKADSGEETVLEYLHRGKYFGIISLLTSEPHSVTAKTINDCLLLVISKDDFTVLLKKIPTLAIDLSRTLSRRLKDKDIHQKIIFESTIISVFSSYARAGRSVYALNLALSLRRETSKSVIILDICSDNNIHSQPVKMEIKGDCKTFDLSASLDASEFRDYIVNSAFGVDLLLLSFKWGEDDADHIKRLLDVLSRLVNDYHYIVLDLPSKMDQTVFEILNQSDIIHVLSGSDTMDLKRTNSLIMRLHSDFHFLPGKIKVIVNEYKLAKLSCQQQLDLLGHPIFATLPKIELGASDRLVLEAADCEYAKAIRRISRQLGDCRIGLALGVGVAYGFCHIGVLKVIEEEEIPIDIISGSSIGALVAALWAVGRSSKEILEITKEFRKPQYLWSIIDLTFPWLGFIKGKKLRAFLKRHLGSMTFCDVRLPLKIIASNVRKKEIRLLDKGLLADAVMASCSMPGVFAPFKSKEQMLFDGGILNPLPTEALFKAGVKKIIAVNVTPSRDDILKQQKKIKQGTVQQDKERKGFSLKRFLVKRFKTNILDIIFSTIEMMQSEMAEKEAQLADIVLHPNTQGLYWLELHKAREFAKRGEEEARRRLKDLKGIIKE